MRRITVFSAASAVYGFSANAVSRSVMMGLTPAPYTLAPRYDVSVIIPAYNEEKYIGKLLSSLTNQTEPVAEIIVADCSDDATPNIARQWGASVVSVPYGNLSQSRNMGIEGASGEVFLFADADMILAHRCVERLIDKLDAGAALAHPKQVLYDSMLWNSLTFGGQLFRPRSFVGSCFATWDEVFRNVGGFDEECDSVSGEFCLESKELADRVTQMYGAGSLAITASVLMGTSARRFKKYGFAGGLGENFHTQVRSRLPVRAAS